ncbi:ATP synthase subunit beta [Polymorphobacter glacialis]|uniref:ATP synthase subunit beta n=1 Tax=Sandarakinorhabdus glacialis TaxID=1614636 RepID=A0A917EAP7_9SPHN|nr:SAM-dependent methyltransferase [Polymorphobacter glacialis]GGE18731.1 ATP synthase subunit beta [Polymorphobacter glacialis]
MSGLAEALRGRIAAGGPLRLDDWMAACNGHYYAGRDPFGAAGDFVTAPEISQMFGELIGGWVGDLWTRAGCPEAVLSEFGPGRGTLMGDLQRVLGTLPAGPGTLDLHLVETSPVLRAAQTHLPATWHDRVQDLPDDKPMIVVANEFFDALPIRQFLGGAERVVDVDGDGFVAATLPSDAPPGEVCEPGLAIMALVGERLRRHGGAALIIDYGYWQAQGVDSLQALRHHESADPFAAPGESDLTAHVDFAALARAAGDVRVSGPLPQGVWLGRLGIEARAAALKRRATPAQAAGIEAALVRLTAPTTMGALFKVMALSSRDWPVPAGFDA